MNNRTKGTKYEDMVVQFVLKKGYRIIERNFYSKAGEIDIIAKDGKYLVFIEVRSSEKSFVHPLESINKTKINRIIKSARFYLYTHNIKAQFIRFDVVGVIKGKEPILIKDAFQSVF